MELGFNKFHYLYLGIFIFIILFYIFLHKFFENNKKEEKVETKPTVFEDINDTKQKIYDQLLLISEKSESYQHDEFYGELNILFRQYFIVLGIKQADTMTLQELKNQEIEHKIFDLFQTSYMHEFSQKQDSLSQRKQIIMNFMIYLKK